MTTHQELTLKAAVIDPKDEVQNEDLDTIQRSIEDVAKKINHTTDKKR